jgi:uncharacterized membrane protein YccC
MSEAPERINLFFRLAVAAGAVFVITIFALVATMFGDPDAPPNRFLDRHGGTLIAVEVAVTLSLGWLAMRVDRRQIVRRMRQAEPARPVRTRQSDRPTDRTVDPAPVRQASEK